MKHCKNTCSHLIVWVAVLTMIGTSGMLAQLPPDVAKYGYADTIFVNGKVVSMDDISNSTSPGNIYQGIAVKHDKIMKLGTTQEIRSVAGPDTQVFDLKGRTIIPGIIDQHLHWNRSAITWGYALHRGENTFTLRELENALKERTTEIPDGEWITLIGRHNYLQFLCLAKLFIKP